MRERSLYEIVDSYKKPYKESLSSLSEKATEYILNYGTLTQIAAYHSIINNLSTEHGLHRLNEIYHLLEPESPEEKPSTQYIPFREAWKEIRDTEKKLGIKNRPSDSAYAFRVKRYIESTKSH